MGHIAFAKMAALTLLFISAATIPSLAVDNAATKEQATLFLDEAVAYVRDLGLESALAEFNRPDGSFVRGELYIFAYDLNGTCLAHPINPGLVGRTGLLDENGVDVVGREIALAKRGGGSMYIVFSNPVHEGRSELKQLFIQDVNDSIYLGTGIYLSNISASFDQEARDGLVELVDRAKAFADQSGRDEALLEFNDPEGNFTEAGRYIFAYDYEGVCLALPYQPELVGTSRIDAQDPNGVYFIRQILDVAENGSGFDYYIYPDPSKNMTPELKLSWVVRVDDEWFLGSGIYSGLRDES